MKIWRIIGFKSVKPMLEGSSIAEEVGEEEEEGNHSSEFPASFSENDWLILDISSPKKKRMSENSESITNSSTKGPQDADYSYIPPLSYELENLVFARFPRSEYWKLCFVNKRCLSLLKTGELYKIRKEIGHLEPSVFMFASGESSWWAFDREFKSRWKLPILPSDPCFASGDKESFCAGTHLLVSGREIDGLVVWRYDLASNIWQKVPPMINPRCLFASATFGDCAYVAGGMGATSREEVYDTAEKYNPESGAWAPLPRMKKKRKLCAGFYMDDRFYVIGGRNEDDGGLTCGEFFDEKRNRWEVIADMVDDPVQSSHSPPLLAVVNNELYSLEASSNQLKVYLKGSNTWKQLGRVPVRADYNRGWGVAFKSLGNELMVIGAAADSCTGNHMAIYSCCPEAESGRLEWKLLESGRNRLSHFIWNCSVMVA